MIKFCQTYITWVGSSVVITLHTVCWSCGSCTPGIIQAAVRVSFFASKSPVVGMTPVACSIKQRCASKCVYFTLPFSLMGSHCVLTFKFPRYLPPCLFRCFPPSAISSWGPGNWRQIWSAPVAPVFCLTIYPPLLFYLPFLTKSVLICYVFHLSPPSLSHYFSILLLPSSISLSLLMRVKGGELCISMHTINPLSQQKPDIWAAETMAAQGNWTHDWRHTVHWLLYWFLIKWQKDKTERVKMARTRMIQSESNFKINLLAFNFPIFCPFRQSLYHFVDQFRSPSHH